MVTDSLKKVEMGWADRKYGLQVVAFAKQQQVNKTATI